MDWGLVSGRGKRFSKLNNIQTGFGAHLLSPGVKQSWLEVDHSFPSNAEVKNDGAIPPPLHPSSWRGA
jgi:hypothetical protein